MSKENQIVERLKQLPQQGEDTWMGALVRLPGWVGEGEKAFRPRIGLWASITSGRINMTTPVAPEEAGFHLLLEAMLGEGRGQGMSGYRPGRLLVADPEAVQYLKTALAGTEIEVEQAESDEPIRELLRQMAKHMSGGRLPPGALEGKDVTVERMWGFAEAARRYYLAAPWQYLIDEDLIQIESPKPPIPEMSFTTVIGAAGRAFGLGFFKSREQHEAMYGEADPITVMFGRKGTAWSVLFGPIQDLPLGDADLFEDEGLPVAGEKAYPIAAGFEMQSEGIKRPDAATLAFLEGLLLALAQTSEEELDRGRWSKRVPTAEGEKEYVLSMPYLLEDMEGTAKKKDDPLAMLRGGGMERMMRDIGRMIEEQGLETPEEINEFLDKNVMGKPVEHAEPQSPEEEAQDLVYEAHGAMGRRAVQLARQALALWPDCADAYVLLGERAGNLEKACDLFRQGVAAGKRAIGEEMFKVYEEEARFWGFIETRPYMRARHRLAECLWDMDRKEEAAAEYQEMLRLNPGDNQGIRYSLAPLLYELGRYDELQKLLDQYADHGGHDAGLQYIQALLSFRREGDSPHARQEVAKALKANRHLKKYLLGDAELPPFEPEAYSPGGEDEALMYAENFAPLWQQTEGAVAWLKKQKATTTRGGSAKPKGKGKRKKK